MPRAALIAFALCLTAVSLPQGAPAPWPATVVQVVRSRGLPPLSAREARVEAGQLQVGGLAPVAAGGVRGLSGRALLYCGEADLLVLRLAMVGHNMKRAAPALGREGPHVNLREVLRQDAAVVEPLARPVRVTLVLVDERGLVCGTRTATVSSVRLAPQAGART
jgi:hypothetical protein